MTLPMQQLGEKMYTKGVREVIFVHGTAVGNDPLDIFNEPNFFHPLDPAIEESVNALLGGILNDNLIDTIKGKIKEYINNTLSDFGNYSPNYVTKFGKALGNGICEHNTPFVWGGGNS
ncbi:MAG: hypothetical protein LV471_12310, partial [Nitrosomonas sp.]|nr:hypothetical protein [Nitrosomonas sp.]